MNRSSLHDVVDGEWPDEGLLAAIQEAASTLFDASNYRKCDGRALLAIGLLVRQYLGTLLDGRPRRTDCSRAQHELSDTTRQAGAPPPGARNALHHVMDPGEALRALEAELEARRPSKPRSREPARYESRPKKRAKKLAIHDFCRDPNWCISCRRKCTSTNISTPRLMYMPRLPGYVPVHLCYSCLSRLRRYQFAYCPNCYRVAHSKNVVDMKSVGASTEPSQALASCDESSTDLAMPANNIPECPRCTSRLRFPSSMDPIRTGAMVLPEKAFTRSHLSGANARRVSRTGAQSQQVTWDPVVLDCPVFDGMPDRKEAIPWDLLYSDAQKDSEAAEVERNADPVISAGKAVPLSGDVSDVGDGRVLNEENVDEIAFEMDDSIDG